MPQVRPFTPVFRWPRDSYPHPHAVYATPNGGKIIKPEPRFSPPAAEGSGGFNYLISGQGLNAFNPAFSPTGVRKVD